ncbi:MAG: right-handed parallel beta-helix repeat-containing protein [Actinobacteria bacterium]|nr:right-handed parallel beta-helix repeat-containing protein [Actinomycetota bacterium]MBE3122632.1 right-handed parallel beta-helix repeat-containing protein [Thermoplasmata archaeon]
MKRKCLAVGIILLFVGTAIIPSSAQKTEKASLSMSKGKTLYVGGSGPGNYSRITDAVNNASNGDTVFVYHDSSPYYENTIWINTSINLIGENRYTTIIDGGGGGYRIDVIRISANKVKVTGFTIQNCSRTLEDTGIYIGHAKDHGINHFRDIKTVFNANVSGNIFVNTATGIMEYKTFHTIISGNLITSMGVPDGIKNTTSDGIKSEAASSTIRGNTILNTRVSGMAFSFTHCLVEGNVISNGSQYGIYLGFSVINSISYNNISHCGQGIFVEESVFNFITNNNITFCEDCGFLLINSIFTTVKENNFINNSVSALFMKSIGMRWFRNYWDDWKGIGPKIILGYGFAWVNFDWHPAKEPYDIPVMC